MGYSSWGCKESDMIRQLILLKKNKTFSYKHLKPPNQAEHVLNKLLCFFTAKNEHSMGEHN